MCLIEYAVNCFLLKHLTSDSAGISFHPWNIQLLLGAQNNCNVIYIQNAQIGRTHSFTWPFNSLPQRKTTLSMPFLATDSEWLVIQLSNGQIKYKTSLQGTPPAHKQTNVIAFTRINWNIRGLPYPIGSLVKTSLTK